MNVIIPFFNYCRYPNKVQIANETINQIKDEFGLRRLIIIELVYGLHKFQLTPVVGTYLIKVRTQKPLFHKENLINLAIERLTKIDPNWEYVAWIDCDLEMESLRYLEDAVDFLSMSGPRVCQLFSKAFEEQDNCRSHTDSFAKNVLGHPGYAWSCNRLAYNAMGGLFDKFIVGSGDHVMTLCFAQDLEKLDRYLNGFKLSIKMQSLIYDFYYKCKDFKMGYVNNCISHKYHGNKMNRRYFSRLRIIEGLDPDLIIKEENGVYKLNALESVQQQVINYFVARKEDE
jgi:hypothetical protein